MFILNEMSPSQRRAKAKAAAVAPRIITHRLGEYEARGSGGDFYAVRVFEQGGRTIVDCSCTAAQFDSPCYHGMAAVAEYRLGAVTPAPERDPRLALIERDLRFIARHVETINSDFETVEDIAMAVRAALGSLFEYERRARPGVESDRASLAA